MGVPPMLYRVCVPFSCSWKFLGRTSLLRQLKILPYSMGGTPIDNCSGQARAASMPRRRRDLDRFFFAAALNFDRGLGVDFDSFQRVQIVLDGFDRSAAEFHDHVAGFESG